VATPVSQRNGAGSPSKSISEVVSELWVLTTTYAKQQTIDPLRGIGRFLAFGVAGAVCWGIGLVLLLLAGLRALQTQTSDTFGGNWSWAPYLIVLVVGTILMVIGLTRITRRKGPGA
jgi:hypothetical protein